MFTVALIGPDGAGKTTICQRLEQILPLPTKYVYMGINLETSRFMLPSTLLLLQMKRWFGKRPDLAPPSDRMRDKGSPKGMLRRASAELKSGLRLMIQLGEEWFQQCVVWFYVSRGNVVLFDRHFFTDYYASDVADRHGSRPLSSRVHGFLLDRFYPRPDLVISLDAPPAILFARKGEGTLESLERRRWEYRQLEHVVEHFYTIDATRSADVVTNEISELIREFYGKDFSTQRQARERLDLRDREVIH